LFSNLSFIFVLVLIPWWIIWHFSSSLRSPTPNYILQARLLDSFEKSFLLPVYAEAMARASLPTRPTCALRPCHGIDPRVLNFFDINTSVDTSFPANYSDSGYNSQSGEIFESCSDDSISTSS
jgi:hypothetical protein